MSGQEACSLTSTMSFPARRACRRYTAAKAADTFGGGDGHQKHDSHHGDEGPDRIYSDDEPATVENQLPWLDEGFADVDCLWKDRRETLLCGIRAAD